MKILYISSVPSKKQFDYAKKMLKPNIDGVKYGMQESGYKFHHLIQEGIIFNSDNEIYSIVGRPISNKCYKGLYWKNEKETNDKITYEHIGFLNLPVIKNLTICFSYFFKTLKWIKKNEKEEKIIILDAAYVTVIPFVNFATKIRKCKKIAIVCDIYSYMAPVDDARENRSRIHKIISKMMKKNYMRMDGFVFLTDAMNKVLNHKNKPYIVMEGLVDINMKTSANTLKNKNKKDIIMYAGAIREKYGLKNLAEGFKKYKNENAELWIYGAGDYVTEIREYEKKDKRIKYFGVVPNKEIIEKELEATLLINPRSANLEFTKYSFPSKNMEYMVSGTPIITTKLPGMPKEYYDYVYTIDGETGNDITEVITNVLKLSKDQLHKKGEEAKKFVLEKKNNKIQAQRILDLCKEVNDENS